MFAEPYVYLLGYWFLFAVTEVLKTTVNDDLHLNFTQDFSLYLLLRQRLVLARW